MPFDTRPARPERCTQLFFEAHSSSKRVQFRDESFFRYFIKQKSITRIQEKPVFFFSPIRIFDLIGIMVFNTSKWCLFTDCNIRNGERTFRDICRKDNLSCAFNRSKNETLFFGAD